VVISRVGEIELQATKGALPLMSGLAVLSVLRWGGGAGIAAAGLIAGSLLLHELGHLLMARALGVRVKAIGFCLKGAYLQRSDSRRAHYELLIASAGPASNLLIFAFLRDGDLMLRWVAILNLVLAISNLIPFPGTDGARMCQSLQTLTSDRSGFRERPSQ
jgi:Zn-dependent protease